jgi:hypothetical protein
MDKVKSIEKIACGTIINHNKEMLIGSEEMEIRAKEELSRRLAKYIVDNLDKLPVKSSKEYTKYGKEIKFEITLIDTSKYTLIEKKEKVEEGE